MAVDFGLGDKTALITFLAKAHSDGLVVVLNKVAKECLVGAADERFLKLAIRKAREEVLYQLWAEGYRADPYEH
jgi:hypothetical protein